ncbi:MAG: penicillin-binding protein 1A [Alphaproteobacteria bacterium]|nr:penicillin-binding protein 1A [Alphaproteobacteria bacterium]
MRFLIWFMSFCFFAVAVAAIGLVIAYSYFGDGLPEHNQLASYDPPTMTRVHAGNGQILAEFATEKRVYVPINAIPQRVINAFLAAEDKNFYQHSGIDALGIVRAVFQNVQNYMKGRRLVGASTITQQVAKNFLLSNEVSIDRKIREAILAFRIEQTYAKDRILELYLNAIYLGSGSYGVAAAALNYFNKSLDELTIAEAAYLAALPKAPSNYHPIRKLEQAIERRNWVIDRMLDEGFVTEEEASAAAQDSLEVTSREDSVFVKANYFAEEVRRDLYDRYGEDVLYGGGLSVHTTLSPRLQKIAESALRNGLVTYDRRHGWRGPETQIEIDEHWSETLAAIEVAPGVDPWQLAVVLEASAESARIGFADGSESGIPLAEVKWARAALDDQKVGAAVKRVSDVLNPGDVVAVEPVAEDSDGNAYPEGTFALRQVPNVNGAIVAIDPHTGRVLAMSGGVSFEESEFNRATQAQRQPGSAFKPFVYFTALDNGFTPAHIILDAPIVIDQGEELGKWKPANYTDRFYGPSPLRLGIEKSRNLMTVRLAQYVGMDKISQTASTFGIKNDMEPVLAMALGSGETTLMKLTTAYAMLVNGGKRIQPTLIDRIQDNSGATIHKYDQRPCEGCRDVVWSDQPVPAIMDDREQVADPATAYQVVSMLEGVVQRGTGVRARAVGKPIGGKTGTTNDSLDTWFIGFSPDLVAGVFVGFDEPKSLGAKETGSSVSAPIFTEFMKAALADQPGIPFRIPPGIRLVNVSRSTGEVVRAGSSDSILEAFKPGTEPVPGSPAAILQTSDPATGVSSARPVPLAAPSGQAGTGGLY